MSDGVKSEISSDIDQNYSLSTADPKNVQELTIYVSNKAFDSTDKSNFTELFDNFHTFSVFLLTIPIIIMLIIDFRCKLYYKMFKTNSNQCRIK